jgi:hypothetical protein
VASLDGTDTQVTNPGGGGFESGHTLYEEGTGPLSGERSRRSGPGTGLVSEGAALAQAVA